jgi:hypothetical protein
VVAVLNDDDGGGDDDDQMVMLWDRDGPLRDVWP